MTLDKRHLVVSIIMLVTAVVYNVWVFTRPADSGVVANQPPQPPSQGVEVSGGIAAAPIDPTQPVELPDVALDRLPQWSRDPFANLARPAEVVVQAEVPLTEPEPAPEPDPVIGSILYSANRRLVTIDGRVARIGDVVGGIRIVDILPNAVVVESPRRGRRTLTVGAGGGQ